MKVFERKTAYSFSASFLLDGQALPAASAVLGIPD